MMNVSPFLYYSTTTQQHNHNRNAVNEARAAQSNPHINMMDYFYQELFPKNCYKYDPHGKAKDIVQVSHEEMIDFYHQHYHPSNGQAFCYGPQSFVDECLSILDPVLSEFTADPELRKATQVEWQSKDRIISDKAKIPYASIEDTDDFRLAIGWLLNDDIMDIKTQVAWQLIEELLIGTRVAAISKVVGDLNLGEDIIGGLDKSSKQWSLILGVSGIRAESEGTTAANAINDKLLAIVEGGFSENALMAALNKMEYKVCTTVLYLPFYLMLHTVPYHGLELTGLFLFSFYTYTVP
jgi:Zn-dependent M16 (insulinase) family peptidase